MADGFYSGDTCQHKNNPSKIGIVERATTDPSKSLTAYDQKFDSTDLDIHHAFPGGIIKDEQVSQADFNTLYRTGLPAKGTVVVSWAHLPWQLVPQLTLVLESDLIVVDRELLTGDIVRKSADDPMTGIVMAEEIFSNLIPMKAFTGQEVPETMTAADLEFGYFVEDASLTISNVPTSELVWSQPCQVGDSSYVFYDNWFGKLLEVYYKFVIRLENGNIVTAQNSEEVNLLPTLSSENEPEIGDLVTTTKGNLRRGTWHKGSYNPNESPRGVIIGLEISELRVHWLCANNRHDDFDFMMPPQVLGSEALKSDQFAFYDRYVLPRSHQSSAHQRTSLAVAVGDVVRFHGGQIAYQKYTENRRTGIPSNLSAPEDSGGFDTNHFLVTSSHTTLKVLWQDTTVSMHNSTDLLPVTESDDEDDVWPGQFVVTRSQATSGSMIKPDKVGIVQSVSSSDRLALVKWFRDPQIAFYDDELLQVGIGSYTGDLANGEEEVSLYDIETVPSLRYKIGDFAHLRGSVSDLGSELPPHAQERLKELKDAWSCNSSFDWVGEIIGMGLDGFLIVRLGAFDGEPRDVKVPWEITRIASAMDEFGPDLGMSDDDAMDMDLYDEDQEMLVPEEILANDPSLLSHILAQNWPEQDWQTEDGVPLSVEGVQDDWEDVSDEDADMATSDVKAEESPTIPTPVDGSHTVSPSTSNLQHNHDSDLFSYATMFTDVGQSGDDALGQSITGPEKFAVLDGSAPRDHHYFEEQGIPQAALLRRIQKEYSILGGSLPDGVYVRTWESSMHLMRILILGPLETPYEYVPFVIDLQMHSEFPNQPPNTYFHSWTRRSGAINPNLYEDGKICLSLLGTWPASSNEATWSSKSTILQVIVSLLGLVLVDEPFYNEAGYESRSGTEQARVPARLYAERTFFNSRHFLVHALTTSPDGLEDILQALYVNTGRGYPQMLLRALWAGIKVVHRSDKRARSSIENSNQPSAILTSAAEPRRVSPGAVVPLRRNLIDMLDVWANDLETRQHQPTSSVKHLKSQLLGWLDDSDKKVEVQGLALNPEIVALLSQLTGQSHQA